MKSEREMIQSWQDREVKDFDGTEESKMIGKKINALLKEDLRDIKHFPALASKIYDLLPQSSGKFLWFVHIAHRDYFGWKSTKNDSEFIYYAFMIDNVYFITTKVQLQ